MAMGDASEGSPLEQLGETLSRWGRLHGLEMFLYREFELRNNDELGRLALFVLTHGAFDRHLTMAVADARVKAARMTIEDARGEGAKLARRSFSERLDEAGRLAAGTADQKRIAEKF